ncbi:MAG TPA: SPOR domain-containing protein [Bacteroidota bacterium]
MPDVNLIEEEGGESGMQPMSTPPRRGGGGGSKGLLILIIIVVLGGAVFALNKFGIVKLWGKKSQPVITQIQEPAAQEPTYAEVDSAAMMEDTSGVSFVETPPLEPQYESSLVTGTGREIGSAKLEASRVSSNLGGMKGNYTVQVSAWRDVATAEKLVKRLETAGYPAFVEQRSAKDGNWYTVRIGRYESMKEAKKAVDSFAYELKKNYWIDRVRSN